MSLTHLLQAEKKEAQELSRTRRSGVLQQRGPLSILLQTDVRLQVLYTFDPVTQERMTYALLS
jgi:hypothetical protein